MDQEQARIEEDLRGIVAGDVHGAFAHAAQLPPEIRAAVKPFLIHTTAGHTTEIVTAHSVADIIDTVINAEPTVLPLQVMLDNEYLELAGVGGVPVRLSAQGWTEVIDLGLAEDEVAALRRAFDAVAAVSAAVQAS